ncbi:MAG: alpha/beta hydrolase-fold protein [Pseudomonadota bacterium]|nr:alpha/beta hydrolase-fold protein [Pseudomonadota bacterium]
MTIFGKFFRSVGVLSALSISVGLQAHAAPPESGSHASVPTRNESPGPALGVPVHIGTTYTIESDVLDMQRRITVRLPTGYADEANASRKYPVVYLIDGGPEQDFPHIAGIAQLSDTNPAFGEFILVGVETVDRRAEISPAVLDPEKYKDLGAVPGGSSNFREFLRREVQPWVEGRYRTSGRDALIGESLAGLFAMETFLREPDLFDDYVSVSPSLWWEDMEYGKRASEFLSTHDASDRSLRIYIADEGYRQEEGALLIVEALEAAAPAGLRWGFFDMGDEETHKSIFHRAAFDALRDLFRVPDRTWRPHATLSGIALTPRTADMEARAAVECDEANSRRTTPADTRIRREDTFYECVLYDYGDTPTRGNLQLSR